MVHSSIPRNVVALQCLMVRRQIAVGTNFTTSTAACSARPRTADTHHTLHSATDPDDAALAGGAAWPVAALTAAILAFGARSPTHLAQALDRYLPLLRDVCDDCSGGGGGDGGGGDGCGGGGGAEAAHAAVLSTAVAAWESSPQHAAAAVRALLRRGAVPATAVVAHFFSPATMDRLG
jgi:MIF4G like